MDDHMQECMLSATDGSREGSAIYRAKQGFVLSYGATVRAYNCIVVCDSCGYAPISRLPKASSENLRDVGERFMDPQGCLRALQGSSGCHIDSMMSEDLSGLYT